MMKSFSNFFLGSFGFEKTKDFQHKEIKVFALKNKKFLIIPEHWVKELSLVPEERELKITFSQQEEPSTIFFPKNIPKIINLVNDGIKLPVEEFIIYHFSLEKIYKKLSTKVFKYNYQKNEFIPCQWHK